jgi:hypothetical protein
MVETNTQVITATQVPPVKTHTYTVDKCCGIEGTQQSAPLDFLLRPTTTGVLQLQFHLQNACSDIRLHVLLDQEELYTTGFFGATSGVVTSGLIDLSPVPSGKHVLVLRPEGQISGCNTGTLIHWVGTLVVNVSEP